MPMTVDEFIKKKVPAKHHPTVRMIRRLMREAAPKAEEGFSYGMPMWKMKKMAAWLMPQPEYVSLGFTHGTSFEDKYGLLEGKGKVGRHIKLRSVKDVDEKKLTYYIKQMMKFGAD